MILKSDFFYLNVFYAKTGVWRPSFKMDTWTRSSVQPPERIHNLPNTPAPSVATHAITNLLNSPGMTRHRKIPSELKKILNFFTAIPHGQKQNGGHAQAQQPVHKFVASHSGYEGLQKSHTKAAPQSGSSSGTSSPSTRSPVMQKQCINSPARPQANQKIELSRPNSTKQCQNKWPHCCMLHLRQTNIGHYAKRDATLTKSLSTIWHDGRD